MSSSAEKSEADPFEVRGVLSVRDSATVLCVRRTSTSGRNENAPFAQRFLKKYGEEEVNQHPFLRSYMKDTEFKFTSGWEVLLGQSEVINWMKSTTEKLVTMRYPGEFKLAGGNVDQNETLENAAKRELTEEFLRPAETQVPFEDIFLRPMSVKQTRPIRSKSNLMHNYVAIAEENPWLNNLDIDEINRALNRRREEFLAFLKLPDCPYFGYSKHEKEQISPEVFQLRWLPLEEAVENCLTSILDNVFVNEWQKEEFERVGRTRRDPLVMTGAVLVELECFAELESLVSFCNSVSLEQLRKQEQWLFSGMTNDDVVKAFQDRLGPREQLNPSFKPLKTIEKLRTDYANLPNKTPRSGL